MRIIESNVELLKQESGIDGLYKHIENCGRTCYKSENNIKDGSAEKFVNAMIKSHHGAMLEHGTIYLKCDDMGPDEYGQVNCIIPLKGKYSTNPYSKVNFVYWNQSPDEVQSEFCNSIPRTTEYVTTNLRVLVENGWLDDLQYMCEPDENHEKRYTLRFTCDRGVTHELVRHRKFSFAQESSRYCNYGSDKKGEKGLTFICPSWCDYNEFLTISDVIENSSIEVQNAVFNLVMEDIYDKNSSKSFTVDEDGNSLKLSDEESIEVANEKRCELMLIYDMMRSENIYLYLIGHGYKPQQARHVLPTMIKSEICMTGFESDWRFFFDLRLFGKTGAPHPDMLRVANIAKEKLESSGYWESIMKHKSVFNE